jgi:hypothetical protein
VIVSPLEKKLSHFFIWQTETVFPSPLTDGASEYYYYEEEYQMEENSKQLFYQQ